MRVEAMVIKNWLALKEEAEKHQALVAATKEGAEVKTEIKVETKQEVQQDMKQEVQQQVKQQQQEQEKEQEKQQGETHIPTGSAGSSTEMPQKSAPPLIVSTDPFKGNAVVYHPSSGGD